MMVGEANPSKAGCVKKRLEDVLPVLRVTLEADKALYAPTFKTLGIGDALKKAAIGQLVAEGYEPMRGGVRVKGMTQLLALLRDRQLLATNAIAGLLQGVSKAEAERLAKQCVQSGQGRLALRGTMTYLCGPSSDVLTLEALESLKTQGFLAAQALRSAGGKSLFVEDVKDALSAIFHKPLKTHPAPQASLDHHVLQAVAKWSRQDTGLCFVPDAVRELRQGWPLQEILEALLRISRQQKLELRIESGINLLTEEERCLCPKDSMQDFPLSWARLLEEDRA